MNTPTNKCKCNCYCHKEGTFQEEDGVSSTHAPSDCQCHQHTPNWQEDFDKKFNKDGVRAVVFIDQNGDATTQSPAQYDLKNFITNLLKEHDERISSGWTDTNKGV